MTIGVIVGMQAEAQVARRLGWPVAIGGGNAAGAEIAADSLLRSGATALVSFGLAGGLDPTLRPGDIIVPEAVLSAGCLYATDRNLSAKLGGPTPHSLFGSDTAVASVVDKTQLWQSTGAAAVDIESGRIARIAAERKLPFAVLRAICDPAERALPSAALIALDRQGSIAVWRVLTSVLTQPSQLRGLLTLASDAIAARRALVSRIKRIG